LKSGDKTDYIHPDDFERLGLAGRTG